MTKRQAERNDGASRTLVDLEWSDWWWDEGYLCKGYSEAAIELMCPDGSARIDAAERRFLACSPAAREAADIGCGGEFPELVEWEEMPSHYEGLADAAQAADRGDQLKAGHALKMTRCEGGR